MTTAEATVAAVPPAAAPPDEGVTRRVARNSLWLIAQPLLLNAISVLSTGYIARKLGAADYGTFNLGYAQIALFTPICILGLSGIAIRAVAQDRSRAREVIGTLLATRILTTLAGALLAFLWLLLPTYDLPTRLVGMAAILSMVCQAGSSICVSLFQGFERAELTARGQMAGGLILTGLSVLALLGGLGLPGFVGAYVAGAAIQLFLLLRLARRHFFPVRPRWDWAGIRSYLRLTPPFAFTDLVARTTELSALDLMIVGAFLASDRVGPYAAAVGLVARLAVVPCGIVDALYPAVSHWYAEESEQIRRALWRCGLYLMLVTVPLALCLTFTAPTVLWLLFGPEYLSASGALALAAWLLPLSGSIYFVRVSLAAVHQQGLVARLALVSGLLTVALLVLLVPRLGMLGAAVSLVSRELLMLALWRGPFFRTFGRPLASPEARPALLAVGAMLVPLVLLHTSYSHPAALVAAPVSLLAYAAVLVRMGVVDPALLLRRKVA